MKDLNNKKINGDDMLLFALLVSMTNLYLLEHTNSHPLYLHLLILPPHPRLSHHCPPC